LKPGAPADLGGRVKKPLEWWKNGKGYEAFQQALLVLAQAGLAKFPGKPNPVYQFFRPTRTK
jgi:hypothetical protein